MPELPDRVADLVYARQDPRERMRSGERPFGHLIAAAAYHAAAGRLVTLEHRGERVCDRAAAARNCEAYRTLLRRLAGRGFADATEVVVRPIQMGRLLPFDGAQIALDNLRLICQTAADTGALVTVASEGAAAAADILSLVDDLRADFRSTGLTLEARFKRTLDDCAAFSVPGSRVRLCMGEHPAPAALAHQGRSNAEAAYVRCLETLMTGHGYPMAVAGNQRLASIAQRLAQAAGRGPGDYEINVPPWARTRALPWVIDPTVRVRVHLHSDARLSQADQRWWPRSADLAPRRRSLLRQTP
jgi:proline dehydrogenase